MTVAIRTSLVVSAAGERPAKSSLTSLVFPLRDCPAMEHLRPPRLPRRTKAHQLPWTRECPHALAVSLSTVRLGLDCRSRMYAVLEGACYIGEQSGVKPIARIAWKRPKWVK